MIRIGMVIYLSFSGFLFASGLSVFRPVDNVLPHHIEVPSVQKNSVDRLVQETTSGLVEIFKSLTPSIRAVGQLGNSLLEFLLGAGSNQDSAAKEAERLESKLEAGLRLSSKEQLKFDLLQDEKPRCEFPTQMVPLTGIVVFAPGQELLRNLPKAIEEMAKNGPSVDYIRSELAQIWNRTNYQNKTRVTELTGLVAELVGHVIDLRKSSLEYNENLQTFGEYLRAELKKPSFNTVSTSIVLSFVMLDSYLANCRDNVSLDVKSLENLLLGTFSISHCMMGFCAEETSGSPEISRVACSPGFLLGIISNLENIWNARVLGQEVPTVTAGSFEQRNPDWLASRGSWSQIGKGAFATIYRTECRRWAIKVPNEVKNNLPPVDWYCEFLRPTSEYILPIAGMSSAQTGFELIFPCCSSGNLRQAIKTNPDFFTVSLAKKCLWRILKALEACEQSRVIHGDLKSANVLLDRGGKLVLADFGLACPNLPGIPDSVTLVTLGYRPPEVLFKLGLITPATDVFAAAVIFWEMLTGSEFFYETNSKDFGWEEVQQAVMTVVLGIPDEIAWPELYARYPDIAQKLQQLREEMPGEHRLSAAIHRDNLIDKIGPEGHDLWRKMTVWNPQRRIKASEALKHPYFRDFQ